MSSFSEQLISHQRLLAQALETLKTLEPVAPDSLDGECLLQLDNMRLLHFDSDANGTAPQGETNKRTTPLLLCYALVNRPYILDLEPKRSLIRDLIDRGYSVYLIDWGYPKPTDQYLGLDDYIGDYLHSAVERAKEHSQQLAIDLMGICQGGVFSLCYAQLHPHNIRKLITLVTPIDTAVENFTLAQMIKHVDVGKLVRAQGNISGALLNQLYAALKPLALGVHKQLNLAGNFKSTEQARTFMRMERWINDSPDLAGTAAAEFARGLFQQNGLVNKTLLICGQRIDLSRLTQPILNAFGRDDHLVPPASSRALAQLLQESQEYREVELKGGHIGAFISASARATLVDAITQFCD